MTKPSSVHLPNVSPRHRAQAAGGGTVRPDANHVSRSGVSSSADPHQHTVTVSDSAPRRGLSRPRYWLAGSSIVAGLLLMVDVGGVKQSAVKETVCQSVVQADAFLSREGLTTLLAIPERDSKAAVKQAVGEPYCTLPAIEVRAGVRAEREAYPLAFDSDTWVIVLYEGEEYAGYDFKFPND